MTARVFLLAALVLVFSQTARADYISLSGAENARNIAEFRVENDRVQVKLEIFVQDLSKFIELLPDSLVLEAGLELPPVETRMRRFAQETLQVVADGVSLPAQLVLSEPRLRTKRDSPFAGKINPYNGQRIPGPPEDPRVLYVELSYPFDERPQRLEFILHSDDSRDDAASLGFVSFHRGVAVNDFRFLAGIATLILDWEDPWYSRFEQPTYKRWQSAGVKAFIYVEPYEVRYEILARVKDLAAWIDLGLRGDEFIEVDEFEPLKKRIGDYFVENEIVLIDGQEVRPILDRVAFVKYTLTRTIFISNAERMPVETVFVGVILTCVTDGIPQEVSLDWNHFSDRVQRVPTTAVDPAGPFPSFVTPDQRTFTWTNYLKTYTIPTVQEIALDRQMTTMYVPAATALCILLLLPVGWRLYTRRRHGEAIGYHVALVGILVVGAIALYPLLKVPVARPAALAPEVTEEHASEILHALLKNVYRSFDFREEDVVYDRLSESVSGDLLEEIYLQNRTSFEVQRAGGARARVKEVEILNVQLDDMKDNPIGLLFHAEWTASGLVGHWGHIHGRKNRYKAILAVEPVDGAWKITGIELLEEERFDPFAQPGA